MDQSFLSMNGNSDLNGVPIETIQKIRMAMRALRDPDTRLWPVLMELLALARQLETAQSFENSAPDQYTLQLHRISDENESLRQEMLQQLSKVAARSIARACRNGQFVPRATDLENEEDRAGFFDSELESRLKDSI